MFKCIYCRRSEPEVAPSESHVIPDALGVGPKHGDAVCAECNHKTNQQFESPLIQKLALLRNMLGIEGRRGKPGFRAIAKFGNAALDVRLRTPEELDDALFFFKLGIDPDGRKKVAIIGKEEKCLQTQKAYEESHPNVIWSDIPPEAATGIRFMVEMDFEVFATEEAHRVAAKIAFEYYCLKRSPNVVDGYEFDEIRDYILAGRGDRDLCRIVVNRPILRGLQGIPFPIHSVYLDQNLNSPRIIAIVGLFGLIHYRVILKRRGTGLGTNQILYLVNPQIGEYIPEIRGLAVPPDLHGPIMVGPDDAAEALRLLFPTMLDKLNKSIEAMYSGGAET
jgi:hypothetical protein